MGPVALIIIDGWGVSPEKKGNAIKLAKTPTYDLLLSKFPNTELLASGAAVGLPPGLMGNSEVGHLTIGAGRVSTQKLSLISQTIADGSFFSNPVLMQAVSKVRESGGALHIFGLVSDGCVHSSPDHLDGLLELAKREKIANLIIHPLLDGRDTPPKSALGFMRKLEKKIAALGGSIGVVSGRYYAMDRDNRWERVEKFYSAIVSGVGEHAQSASEAVEAAYAKGTTDEFILPTIISPRTIKDGDAVICFNFRPDRVREISRALTQKEFDGFKRLSVPKVYYACMTEYDSHLRLPVAFSPEVLPAQDITMTLPELLSCKHIGQLHTAETEKYAHVTYFLNGGREDANEGEERVLVPSLKVATYDMAPDMQTAEVAKVACSSIKSGKYPFTVLNFANPDMVGHTGTLEAAVEAVQSVDRALAEILAVIQESSGTLFITADHGNCEQMIDLETGEPHTAHTTNPVPFIVADFQRDADKTKLREGGLADVAPTILARMGIAQPAQMTGQSLFTEPALKV